MGKQLKSSLKRGMAFALTVALLWTDASTAAFATSVTPEPLEAAVEDEDPAAGKETPSVEATGTPTPDEGGTAGYQ